MVVGSKSVVAAAGSGSMARMLLTLGAIMLSSAVLPCTAAPCDGFGEPVVVGTFREPAITESSGLVVSRTNPGVVWTHNDSGDGPVLYAAAYNGELLGKWVVAATAVDWEDIALGPCEPGGELSCIYIGDIGNNSNERTDLVVYRVHEPSVDLAGEVGEHRIDDVESFRFSYPDGSWDSESLLVDPLSGDIYLVTKVLVGASRLYRFPELQEATEHVLVSVAEATFGTIPVIDQSTTGGEFAPTGDRFVVRTYARLHEFDVIDGDVGAAFEGAMRFAEVADEQQGEAVSYGPDGRGLWTTHEGAGAAIHEYRCVDGGAAPDEGELDEVEAPVTPSDSEARPEPSDSGKTAPGRGCCTVRTVPARSSWSALSLVVVLSAGLALRRR